MDFLIGLFDSIFRPDKPTPHNIRSNTKAANQPHGDAAPRVNACHRLAEWGTPEAIAGLLKRFTVQTPSGAVDQEEKKLVQHLLENLGEPAVGPILDYLLTGEEAIYPAQALAGILPEDELIEKVTALLARLQDTHTRTPRAKVALIEVLAAHSDPRVAAAVVPYFQDPNDDVCFAAIDCLARAEHEQTARDSILELYLASHDRLRIRTHILDKLEELRWPLKGFRRRLEADLPDGYSVTSKGQVQSRPL